MCCDRISSGSFMNKRIELTLMPTAKTKLNYNCINFSNSFTLFLFFAINRNFFFFLKRKQSTFLPSKHIVPSLTIMSIHWLVLVITFLENTDLFCEIWLRV